MTTQHHPKIIKSTKHASPKTKMQATLQDIFGTLDPEGEKEDAEMNDFEEYGELPLDAGSIDPQHLLLANEYLSPSGRIGTLSPHHPGQPAPVKTVPRQLLVRPGTQVLASWKETWWVAKVLRLYYDITQLEEIVQELHEWVTTSNNGSKPRNSSSSSPNKATVNMSSSSDRLSPFSSGAVVENDHNVILDLGPISSILHIICVDVEFQSDESILQGVSFSKLRHPLENLLQAASNQQSSSLPPLMLIPCLAERDFFDYQVERGIYYSKLREEKEAAEQERKKKEGKGDRCREGDLIIDEKRKAMWSSSIAGNLQKTRGQSEDVVVPYTSKKKHGRKSTPKSNNTSVPNKDDGSTLRNIFHPELKFNVAADKEENDDDEIIVVPQGSLHSSPSPLPYPPHGVHSSHDGSNILLRKNPMGGGGGPYTHGGQFDVFVGDPWKTHPPSNSREGSTPSSLLFHPRERKMEDTMLPILQGHDRPRLMETAELPSQPTPPPKLQKNPPVKVDTTPMSSNALILLQQKQQKKRQEAEEEVMSVKTKQDDNTSDENVVTKNSTDHHYQHHHENAKTLSSPTLSQKNVMGPNAQQEGEGKATQNYSTITPKKETGVENKGSSKSSPHGSADGCRKEHVDQGETLPTTVEPNIFHGGVTSSSEKRRRGDVSANTNAIDDASSGGVGFTLTRLFHHPAEYSAVASTHPSLISSLGFKNATPESEILKLQRFHSHTPNATTRPSLERVDDDQDTTTSSSSIHAEKNVSEKNNFRQEASNVPSSPSLVTSSSVAAVGTNTEEQELKTAIVQHQYSTAATEEKEKRDASVDTSADVHVANVASQTQSPVEKKEKRQMELEEFLEERRVQQNETFLKCSFEALKAATSSKGKDSGSTSHQTQTTTADQEEGERRKGGVDPVDLAHPPTLRPPPTTTVSPIGNTFCTKNCLFTEGTQTIQFDDASTNTVPAVGDNVTGGNTRASVTAGDSETDAASHSTLWNSSDQGQNPISSPPQPRSKMPKPTGYNPNSTSHHTMERSNSGAPVRAPKNPFPSFSFGQQEKPSEKEENHSLSRPEEQMVIEEPSLHYDSHVVRNYTRKAQKHPHERLQHGHQQHQKKGISSHQNVNSSSKSSHHQATTATTSSTPAVVGSSSTPTSAAMLGRGSQPANILSQLIRQQYLLSNDVQGDKVRAEHDKKHEQLYHDILGEKPATLVDERQFHAYDEADQEEQPPREQKLGKSSHPNKTVPVHQTHAKPCVTPGQRRSRSDPKKPVHSIVTTPRATTSIRKATPSSLHKGAPPSQGQQKSGKGRDIRVAKSSPPPMVRRKKHPSGGVQRGDVFGLALDQKGDPEWVEIQSKPIPRSYYYPEQKEGEENLVESDEGSDTVYQQQVVLPPCSALPVIVNSTDEK